MYLGIKDVQVIDILLLKSRQEFEETMNSWKEPTHVVRSGLHTKDALFPRR